MLQQLGDLTGKLFDRTAAVRLKRSGARARPVDDDWPGLGWRFLVQDRYDPFRETLHLTSDRRSYFDELVVGHWLHIEHMHGRHWWMRLGDACINIAVPRNKPPIISIERDIYNNHLSDEEAAAILERMDPYEEPVDWRDRKDEATTEGQD